MNMIRHIYMALLLLSISLSSCKGFLDSDPVDRLVPESFFSNESDLQLYANSFYQRGLPSGLSVVQSDEMGDYTAKIQSPKFIAGSFDAVDQGTWSFTDLRNINYFLVHFDNPSIPQEARNHYEGVARFWRALFYFDKVKTYGDVPWYDTPLDAADEGLYKPRDSRTFVMDKVLEDINFACENIRDTKDNTSSLVTRQVALAFKSRICLFEGTFRKYQTQFGLQGSANKFLEAGADAAKKVMDSGKYHLYSTGKPYEDYRTLFISENPVSEEVMLAVVYNNALRRWHNITWKFNSATYGSRWSLNKQFVNTYLMLDGSRFTDRSGYDELLFTEEMKDRDPRLSQTIRSLGYKRSDGTPAPPNFGYTYTGYHILKFSLDDKQYDGTGEAYNSITLMRYAEVLLNYAETMAELGRFDSSVWSQTIAPLRKRAGISDAEPSAPDEYMRETYFPEISDKYLLEVRRERGIELCYEGLRYDDLMRWKKGDLLEMSWKGIYVPGLDTPMDLDGNGTPDVSFVTKAPSKGEHGVVYFVIDNKASRLDEGDHGHLLWREDEKRSFEERKYLHPISENDIVLNPQLKQNPGW